MDKIKTITKALFVGMGISFFFKVSAYSFYVFIPYLLSLAIISVLCYFFIFKSERIFNLFFKNFPSENSTTEFKIKCLNIFIIFFATLSIAVSSVDFAGAVPTILNIPQIIIDSIVYREWSMININFVEDSLIAILKLLLFLFNVYLLFGTQHFIKLLIKMEDKQNVKL
jgi:hypothetical protein